MYRALTNTNQLPLGKRNYDRPSGANARKVPAQLTLSFPYSRNSGREQTARCEISRVVEWIFSLARGEGAQRTARIYEGKKKKKCEMRLSARKKGREHDTRTNSVWAFIG